MNVGIIIQARMGSSRFPGKVLADLAGKPMIGQLLERLRNVRGVSRLILATSDTEKDRPLVDYCREYGVDCFRGSEENVLKRYYDASVRYGLDAAIRVCGDSPLTDPQGIELLIETYKNSESRFVHNRDRNGWISGTAADLISFSALEEALQKAYKPDHFEHIGTYLVEHADDFKMILIQSPMELQRPDYDLSVDHPQDLLEIRKIYDMFYRGDAAGMNIRDIVRWLDENPHNLRIK